MDTLPEGCLEVDLQWFSDSLLPPLSNDSVSNIVNLLHNEFTGGTSRLHPAIAQGRWRWYPNEPKNMPGPADTVFADLQNIHAVIVAAARTVSGMDGPAGIHIRPEISCKTRLRTGAGKAKPTPYGHCALNSLVNCRFRKSEDNDVVIRNRMQLLTNVAGLMSNDPARHFRFGFTIENTSTRLWFLSRAQCFVSKPFNFITDHHPLVQFLASISFASHEELGHDGTVRRVFINHLDPSRSGDPASEKQVAYDYMVLVGNEETWYQTIDKALFSYHESRLLGRAIRVWKVRRISVDAAGKRSLVGPIKALKDFCDQDHGHVQRKHCRLVLEEVGQPLHLLTDLGLLFQCLADAMKGLKVLYDARCVHRDTCTANLLACQTEDGVLCKILDLEYACSKTTDLKDGQSQRVHNIGTPYFTSIEIQRNRFCFNPRNLPRTTKLPPFLHTYMHDFEGLWWIAMWFLFFSIPTGRTKDVNARSKLPQEVAGESIFSLSLQGSLKRWDFFTESDVYDAEVKNIPPEFGPVVVLMLEAALLLSSHYVAIQDATTIEKINTPEPYAHIYEPLTRLFQDAVSVAHKHVQHIRDVRVDGRKGQR